MVKVFVWLSASIGFALLWLAQMFLHMMITDTPTGFYQIQFALAAVACPCLGLFAAARYRR